MAAEISRHRLDVGEVSLTVFPAGSANRDEHGSTSPDRVAQVPGKLELFPAMMRYQFRQELLMNRDHAMHQKPQLFGVIVNTGDFMSQFTQTCRRNQADVSRANHSNLHSSNPFGFCRQRFRLQNVIDFPEETHLPTVYRLCSKNGTIVRTFLFPLREECRAGNPYPASGHQHQRRWREHPLPVTEACS